jgi:hypothetical protein
LPGKKREYVGDDIAVERDCITGKKRAIDERKGDL